MHRCRLVVHGGLKIGEKLLFQWLPMAGSCTATHWRQQRLLGRAGSPGACGGSGGSSAAAVQQAVEATCVLDFYVAEAVQRTGVGQQLFHAFLEAEGQHLAGLAYDRPSPKCLAFLRKHFGLATPTVHPNRFVTFGALGAAAAPLTPVPTAPGPLHCRRNSSGSSGDSDSSGGSSDSNGSSGSISISDRSGSSSSSGGGAAPWASHLEASSPSPMRSRPPVSLHSAAAAGATRARWRCSGQGTGGGVAACLDWSSVH